MRSLLQIRSLLLPLTQKHTHRIGQNEETEELFQAKEQQETPEELSEVGIGKLPSRDQDNDHENIQTWEKNG